MKKYLWCVCLCLYFSFINVNYLWQIFIKELIKYIWNIKLSCRFWNIITWNIIAYFNCLKYYLPLLVNTEILLKCNHKWSDGLGPQYGLGTVNLIKQKTTFADYQLNFRNSSICYCVGIENFLVLSNEVIHLYHQHLLEATLYRDASI